jgi:hypothetical protein
MQQPARATHISVSLSCSLFYIVTMAMHHSETALTPVWQACIRAHCYNGVPCEAPDFPVALLLWHVLGLSLHAAWTHCALESMRWSAGRSGLSRR